MSVIRFLNSGSVSDYLVTPLDDETEYYTRFTNSANYCYANSIFHALASLNAVLDVAKQENSTNPSILYETILLASKSSKNIRNAETISREFKSDMMKNKSGQLIYERVDRNGTNIAKFLHGEPENAFEFFEHILKKTPALYNLFSFSVEEGSSQEMGSDPLDSTAIVNNNGTAHYIKLFPDKFPKNTLIDTITLTTSISTTNLNKDYFHLNALQAPNLLCIYIPSANSNVLVTETAKFYTDFTLQAIVVCHVKDEDLLSIGHYISYCNRKNHWLEFNDMVAPIPAHLLYKDLPNFDNTNSTCTRIPDFFSVQQKITNKPMILFYSRTKE